uniref:Peptidase A2 domain-containing protein n=1 Tax=Phlebotomus papatasi TaxID=29031 RepID=A0A1B0D7X9_PHLPP
MEKFLNFPPFKCQGLPEHTLREQWVEWKRAFDNYIVTIGITDPTKMKSTFLTLGGIELQRVFYRIRGADVSADPELGIDPYKIAVQILDAYFTPKRHDSYERHMFWTLKPRPEETLQQRAMRVIEQADKCDFGDSKEASRAASIIDKIMMLVPDDLRKKMLARNNLTVKSVLRIRKNDDSRKDNQNDAEDSSDNKKRRIRVVEDNRDEDSENNFIFNIGEGDEYVCCKIGGVLVEMLIDSGSTHNVLDEKTWEYLKKNGVRITNATT